MLELGSISLTVFSYVTEENDRVVQALQNALSQQLKSEKLTKIATTSQFGDPLVIYSYETDDEVKVDTILQHIGQAFSDKSKEYLDRHLSKKIDLNNRSVYFRLDKYKAYEGELYITEGSDVIQIEVGYTAYTNKQNSEENVVETLRQFSLLG